MQVLAADDDITVTERERWLVRAQQIRHSTAEKDIFRKAPPSVTSNLQVMLAAVQNDGYALEYASADLKDNVALVMAAVRQNARALQYAGEVMKNNYDVALIVAQTYPFALAYASAEIQKKVPLWLVAVDFAPYSILDAPPAVQSDPQIVARLAKNGYRLECEGESPSHEVRVVDLAEEEDEKRGSDADSR